MQTKIEMIEDEEDRRGRRSVDIGRTVATKGAKIAMILSSALLAMNYALVPANWGLITRTLANKTKSQTWIHDYFGYCVSQMASCILTAHAIV